MEPFWGGWLGGQVSGLLTLIPSVGTGIGSFVGSIVTDSFDLGMANIDWGKAVYTSIIASVFNIFSAHFSEFLDEKAISNLMFNAITVYDTILVSAINSIVNVFWRGYDGK